MGCDWISGDCLAVGYGIDYESLFVVRDVDTDDALGCEEDYDEDENEDERQQGEDKAEDEKGDQEDAKGGGEDYDSGNPSPLSVVRSSWRAFLVKNDLRSILEKKIEPYIGVTSMPAMRETQRYKNHAMVIFGTTLHPANVSAANDDDETVAVPAVAFPKNLDLAVNDFVKEFITPSSISGREPSAKKKRYCEPTYKTTATLMTVIFVN
jgi:hypothetical protein